MPLIIRVLLCTATMVGFAATPNPELDPLHLNWMDAQISPTQNFYGYANGTWQKTHAIPSEYPSWSTFSVLQKSNQKILHRMIIDAAKTGRTKPGSIEQKVGDFYFSGMDDASINKLGTKPLQDQFTRIESMRTLADLQAIIPYFHHMGLDVFFSFGSMQDFKDSTQMIGAVAQGGLSLPDRDYYLKTDEKFTKIRAAFVQHMTNMFEHLGDAPTLAAEEANTVLRIETGFAKASMPQTTQRDPRAIYHMMSIETLKKNQGNFSWPRYFTAMGHGNIKRINMAMPDFIKAMDTQLQTVSMADWKTYLRWHMLHECAPYLSQVFVDEHFKLVTALTGTEKLRPRWQRVVSAESSALGFAIGKLYVESYFSPAAKREVLIMIHNIRKALAADLKTLPWMTESTRQAALKKLSAIEQRVGYPDKWWDYSALSIDRGPYVLNVIRASQFLVKRDLDKIDKPVDRSEWGMTPQTINAYYDPSMNNINIPTGILQPPFYDISAPAAVNYGAIGFVIGHEMTHGFDDQGAKFDEHGNLRDWWSPTDLEKFHTATACIVKQFSQYQVNGLSVQGALVVGEATADLGGLMLAYRAFHASNAYKTAKNIHGFTPDQQFFLSAAHIWASNTRPEEARNLITVDPHPPAVYRVNGTMANLPEFQAAFSIPNQSPMVNKDRCVIW